MTRRTRERGQPKVLVVDDEPDLLELLELTLSRMGLDSTRAQTVAEAINLLDTEAFDLCLTDMRLPDGQGLRVVEHITDKGLDVPVAVITAFGSAENAVAALKAGAFDYLAKPVALEQLRALVKQALKVPEKPATSSSYQLLGESPAILQVRSMIERLAKSQAPVFITGESGSGKELAARMIHLGGPRAEQPFIPVNCGAIPENLMESEFFGYKQAAHSPARKATATASSRPRTAARCFSTKSPTCRWRCRSSCCARSRRRRCARSAQPRKSRSTCASSAQRTRSFPLWSRRENFARIFSIVCT